MWHFCHFFKNCRHVKDITSAFPKTTDKREFNVLIWHCSLAKTIKVKTQEWLVKHYDTSNPPKTMICLYIEFKCDYKNMDDAPCSRLPIQVIILIFQQQSWKFHDFCRHLKISCLYFTNIQIKMIQETQESPKWR